MKQERILLLGPTLIAVGGVTTHLNQLLGSDLAKHFELLHFQVGSEGRLETTLQKIIRFAFSPLAFLLFLIQHRPAIVHFNTSFDTKSYWRDVVYLTIAHALKCKILFQKHGGPLPQEFFSGYPLLTSLLRHVLTWADVIVLLGFEEAKAYKQFVPNVRTEVIPNAIDVGTLIADPLSGKQHGPLQLVYLGRLERNKGVFEIMDAFAALVGQGRDLRLTIGGGGSEAERLRKRVTALRLDDRVIFTGPVFGKDKDKLWREGHVFVFPTYREGLPYALLEAMAAGTVPITTPVGAIPDVMQDGVHGLFVEAKDPAGLAHAIARLDDDRNALARMAEAGRRRILENYTVARLVEDFSSVYSSLKTST